MIETVQLEESVVERYDAPEAAGGVDVAVARVRHVGPPALRRSEARLAGEAPFGLIPLRIMIPSYVLEAFLIFAAIFVQVKIAELRPFVAPRFSSHDVHLLQRRRTPPHRRSRRLSGWNQRPRRGR